MRHAGTIAAPPLVRRGIVYGFRVLHPDTGLEVWGYVGQTRQPIADREDQHREVQPWADTIVGEWHTDPVTRRLHQAVILDRGEWTNEELDAREDAYINAYRPLYNIVGNRRNPHRVKPWVAKRQRHQRDRAAGRALWQPHRPTVTSPRTPHRSRRPEPRRSPVKVRINWSVVVVAQVWIVVTGGLAWATAGRWGLSFGTSTGIVATVVVYRWIRRAMRQTRAAVRRWR